MRRKTPLSADTSQPAAITISRAFIRSINLRRDAVNPLPPLRNYLLSTHTLTGLQRLLTGLELKQHAWTLTGPYGSGKSLFALFLSCLLDPHHPGHAAAIEKLQDADPELLHHLSSVPRFAPVLAVGRRASPGTCLLEALVDNVALPAPLKRKVRAELGRSDEEPHRRDGLVLEVLEAVTKNGQRPLLLVVDELGKTLEYSALNPHAADLFLLQQIAEQAPRWRILFIGILHQAFEHYAQALELEIRHEWAKIQGRFEDIPFIESPEQMMRLTALAIEADCSIEGVRKGREICESIAKKLVASNLAPAGVQRSEFIRLAARAFPLHPLVVVLLPYLFRHHGQNERSLFAFLALHEPFGLQHFLRSSRGLLYPTALFGLEQLFDYVSANFGHAVYTSLPLRPIAEAKQVLRRETWDHDQKTVLKTLALLQWASGVSYLRPTSDALKCAVWPSITQERLDRVLGGLQRRSAIVFRSFNKTYRVWQGSDVNVEERIHEARREIGSQISLAELLNRLAPPSPVVARRHSYQTGTLRVFEVRYVDDLVLKASSFAPLPSVTGGPMAGVVCVCLPRGPSQMNEFESWARWSVVAEQARLVVGVPQRPARLHQLLVELACLNWVQEHTPALRDDPVASRELRERMELVAASIREQVHQALRACRWFYRGEDWTLKARPSLSALLSELCDTLYSAAPILPNELVNRWSLSSSAAAGRRNLIQAMLEKPDEETLGIEGYPPERSIYESILRETQIHVPEALGWKFQEPPQSHPSRLYPVWQRLCQRIFAEPPERVGVHHLLEELVEPPFGLTPGVFPILLCAFLQVYRDETTLYREGTFLPEPGVADWEVLLRRPELFSVAGCRVEGPKAATLQLIAERWKVPAKTVPIVRELVRRIRRLPEHAMRTKRLSSHATGLREAVVQAFSPERLLFSDIPSALEVPFEEADRFCNALDKALTELQEATPRVVTWARDTFLRACGLPLGMDGWRVFRQQASALRGRVLYPQLTPLLLRASTSGGGDGYSEETMLESVLASIAGRSPRAWTDGEIERFPDAAKLYGEAFRQALLLASHEMALSPEQTKQRDALVVQIRRLLPAEIPQNIQISALLRLIEEVTKK